MTIAKTLSDISQEARRPEGTVYDLQRRGVLPLGDVQVGRLKYFSPELAAAIVKWLQEEYKSHVRGQVFRMESES